MVEMIDVFPTLVELAGLEIPEYLEGTSLLPVLEDPGLVIKDYSISQYPRGKNIMGYSIRSQQYRLTLWLKGDYMGSDIFRDAEIEGIELYDYYNDPLEKVSLAYDPDYAETVSQLKAKLLALLTEQADRYAGQER